MGIQPTLQLHPSELQKDGGGCIKPPLSSFQRYQEREEVYTLFIISGSYDALVQDPQGEIHVEDAPEPLVKEINIIHRKYVDDLEAMDSCIIKKGTLWK